MLLAGFCQARKKSDSFLLFTLFKTSVACDFCCCFVSTETISAGLFYKVLADPLIVERLHPAAEVCLLSFVMGADGTSFVVPKDGVGVGGGTAHLEKLNSQVCFHNS